MYLDDVMDSRMAVVSANDYASEALRLMNLKKLQWVFVLEQSQVSGVVFSRDLERLSETVLKERDVREFQSPNLLMVGVETEPQEAARLLRLSGREFLAVIKDNRPVGILTEDSLARSGRRFTQRRRQAS